MTQRKLYRYIGRNGTITSPVLLEDIKHIALMELIPQSGYVLTNGIAIKKDSAVVHIDDVKDWYEIAADTTE